MTILKGMPLLIATVGMSVQALCQTTAPIPENPFEIVSGPIQVVNTPDERNAILKLLDRARSNYALRKDGPGYNLKVSFTVDSAGETQYDGAWEMEEVYAPGKGLRWTAKTPAGYTATRISHDKRDYVEGPAGVFPLRLHEARGALFGPIATSQYVDRDLIRTSTATLNGVELTCVLLSGIPRTATLATGRQWEESEECIDPQSGRLVVHSLAPGRYEMIIWTLQQSVGARCLKR